MIELLVTVLVGLFLVALCFASLGAAIFGIGSAIRPLTRRSREQKRVMAEYNKWRATHPKEAAERDFHEKYDQESWDAMNE
jgi:hypothetical protein